MKKVCQQDSIFRQIGVPEIILSVDIRYSMGDVNHCA